MAELTQRSSSWFAQPYEAGKQQKHGLHMDSLQVAEEKLRQIESAQFRGEERPLPTRTPVGEVVAAYIAHMRASFGECCAELQLASGCARNCQDLRLPEDSRQKVWPLPVTNIEDLSPAAIRDFLAAQVRVKGLAPKTANRCREVIGKLIAWAMKSERVRMPLDRNPIRNVGRYREPAPEIRYLTLAQIDEQLNSLPGKPWLQTMVATLIYAGLRREELPWLQVKDFVRSTAQAPNGLLRIQAKLLVSEAGSRKRSRTAQCR